MSTTSPLKGDGQGRYRIEIIGNSGAGKSTIAAQLSEILGIPFISLDTIFWLPNWESVPTEEFRVLVQKALDQDERGWIVDGNYLSQLGDLVGTQATDTIWLDPPFMLYFPRLCYRTFLRALGYRQPCSPGCDESWSNIFTLGEKSIIWWCWTNHDSMRERTRARFGKGVEGGRRIGGWGSELNAWLEDVKKMVRDA